MSYQIIQEIEQEEARCGTCQSGVDELYHPLRECGMHAQYVRQAEEENVLFEDTKETQFYSFPAASPDFSTDSSPQQMGDFLARPTLIHTITWNPGSVSDNDFDPWTLFFDSDPIERKLSNFAYFRGNMHIKVVVNASPFHYGCMLINYTPTPLYVQTIDNSNSTALIPQSQKPHIWIDLRENMGGEMILPFIYPYNYINITNKAQLGVLGRMRNINYFGIRSANGSTTNPVTVKIYAWIEGAELTCNTNTLALQAKKQSVDEYGTGPVSRPATALAHWASYLTNVPIIGTYAKATQIGATAVSSVAGLFGWTNVPVIEDVKPVKPLFFHDLASAHLAEPMSKVTLDPKAELSVDPKIVCSSTGEDELSISHIVQKDSFLCQTMWYSGDTPDNLLYSVAVTPDLYDIGTPTSSVYQIGFTPMAYLARMFYAWRGDIIFTVKVIASQYHRGRLRIHWDPNTLAVSGDVSNTTLTKIVDIGERTEVEFRVPYVNFSMWSATSDTLSNKWHPDTPVTVADGVYNGTLNIRVLNQLSAPTDTVPVSLMIFVRGAENLEFADPRTIGDQFQHYVMQGLVEDVQDDTQQESTPLNDRYLINYGEAIPSLRLMMRRSVLHASNSYLGMTNVNDGHLIGRVYTHQSRFPSAPGYDTNAFLQAKGAAVTGTNFRYNFTHNTPLTWITPMFVARRGSIQWHFHISDPDQIISHLSCTRTHIPQTANNEGLISAYNLLVSAVGSRSSAVSQTNLYSPETIAGTVVTDCKVSPSLSVECPQMSRARYQVTGPNYSTLGTNFDGSSTETYDIEMYVKPNQASFQKMVMHKYVNAGTDYSLAFFLCAPQMFYSTNAGITPA